jgi:predicted RNA methylase
MVRKYADKWIKQVGHHIFIEEGKMPPYYPFSPLLGANLCLSDRYRIRQFEFAIKETIKSGDVVLDAGSGTGILAFLALKYGAGKVYAVEIDDYLCRTIKENAVANGFEKRLEVINLDLFSLDSLDREVNLVLMEMITTGLIEEAQVPAYNWLVDKKIITPSTRVIPFGFETYGTVLEYDFQEYGFQIKRVKHGGLRGVTGKLSRKKRIYSAEFNSNKISPEVNVLIDYSIVQSGVANSICLESIARLSRGIVLGESTWINHPVIVPLHPVIHTEEGDALKIDIKYIMGAGFRNVYAKCQKI